MSEEPRPTATRGVLVVRERRIVYASAGAAALTGRAVADLVGHEFVDFLAPHERARVLERHERRLRGEPVPTEYEAEITLPGGAARVVELTVARDGPDVLVELRDITAAAARRPRLVALARLAAEIHRRRDAGAVFDRVRRGLAEAGLASLLLRPDGDAVVVEWAHLGPELLARFEAEAGRPIAGFRGPWTPLAREAWTTGSAYCDDWMREVHDFMPGAIADLARDAAAEHGLTRAVAVRIDERAAPRHYLVIAGEWLRAEDLPTLRLFGAQVGAALDAVRTIARLERHNVDLAALNRLGELVRESPHLDAFLAEAAAVVKRESACDGVAVHVLAEGGRELRLRFQEGSAPEAAAGFARLTVEGTLAAILGSPSPLASVRSALTPEDAARLSALGFGTFAWVPLATRSGLAGLLSAGWREELPPERIRLEFLQAAGAHFAAGIESHAALAVLRRRVSHLTLLNELARVADALDPVLLLENALQRVVATVPADGAVAFTRDGDALSLAASVNVPERLHGRLRRITVGDGLAGLSLQRLTPVVTRTLAELAPPWEELARSEGVARVAVVPLVSKGRGLGAIALARRASRDFTDEESALLGAIGAQLGVALDNARLYTEARRRAEQLGLVHEVGRSLVATLRLRDVLDAGIRNLARIVEAPKAYLLLASDDGAHLEIRAAAAEDAALVGERLPLAPGSASIASHVFHSRAPLAVERAEGDPRVSERLRALVHGTAYLGLPLIVRDRAIGAVVIIETRGERRFTPAEVEQAAGIANQLAVAVENARLYDDLSRSYAELARAQRQLIRRERLAALGELAAVVAHEVRNPLGVIFNSLGSLRRLVRPTGDVAMLLDIVDEEADRLNRIVGDLLDFSRPSTPVVQPERIERVVEDAVSAATAQRPPGIQVSLEAPEGLPPVPMDARLVRSAVVNLVVNAMQAMPRGGRVTVRIGRDRDAVVVEVADEGEGIGDELRERIFEPFFTTKASGTGLGLAVVKRIVEGHGGEVEVRSRPGEGAAFSLRFPLASAAAPVGADG